MILDILERMGSVLGSDVNLLSFCQENFERDHKVFIGQEIDVPIPISDQPAIVLYGIDAKAGNDNIREISFLVGIVLCHSGKTIEDNIVTMNGFLLSENFAEMVETVILKLPYKTKFIGTEYSSSVFPMFSTVRKFIIESIWPLRG